MSERLPDLTKKEYVNDNCALFIQLLLLMMPAGLLIGGLIVSKVIPYLISLNLGAFLYPAIGMAILVDAYISALIISWMKENNSIANLFPVLRTQMINTVEQGTMKIVGYMFIAFILLFVATHYVGLQAIKQLNNVTFSQCPNSNTSVSCNSIRIATANLKDFYGGNTT